jgi:ATP-dependent DNA ligase
MTSSSRHGGFSEVVRVLNKLEMESEEEKVSSIASLLKSVDENNVKSLLRIFRMDFGEASRIVGTHLARKIVSEAIASITSRRQSEVEELLEAGRVDEALSGRSIALTGGGLTVNQAYSGMLEACKVSGKGSIGSKAGVLARLLNKASDEEAVFIVRTLIRGERQVSDELLVKALEKAFGKPLSDAPNYGDFYERTRRLVEECKTK